MYRACNQLFACACFTRDEDGRITRCDFGDARENTFQSGRCSNDLFKHRGFVDFFTQSDVFTTKPVFRLLAVFDVRPGDIPTRNLSLFVAQWVKTSQEPAITSIAFAHPQLQFVSRARRRSTIRNGNESLHIIRMNVIANPTSLPPLIQTHTKVIERGAIGVKTFETGSEYHDMLRRQVQNLPELHLISAPFLLCFFTLRDVNHSTGVFNEITARAENRMTNAVNVPDGATRMQNAIFYF